MATNKRKQQRFRNSQKKRYFDINRIEFVHDKGKDGIILVRRGVPDLNLDGQDYSQVRIAVNHKYYIRGMGMYGADRNFAPGVDVVVYYGDRTPLRKYRYGEQRYKRPVTTFRWHDEIVRQYKQWARKASRVMLESYCFADTMMEAMMATEVRRTINGQA